MRIKLVYASKLEASENIPLAHENLAEVNIWLPCEMLPFMDLPVLGTFLYQAASQNINEG